VQTPLPLASELYFSIFRAFKENGIEIPFPQRDLHLKSVSPSIRIARDDEGKPVPSSYGGEG
jgi:small-conductance mechanosensitive channel